MKTLITYFSASGTTEKIAKKIAETIDGDLFAIEPKIPYTEADLNWMDKESRSSVEMQDKSSRPEILKNVENLNDYNRVIIGFPVWWYTAPTIINTFIEQNDLKNKALYIYVTSGGSSFAGSLKDLQNTYPELNFVNGIRFTNPTVDEIKEWLEK